MKKQEKSTQKKKMWLWISLTSLAILALSAVLLLILLRPGGELNPEIGEPTLIVETPQKISVSQDGTFTLDVTISNLAEGVYPAASMSISFDPACLELVSVDEGNLFIRDDRSSTGRQLPEWSCNVQNCNASGLINIMYLDTTGGKYAFSSDLLGDGEHVVLRLTFRLRGSVSPGDVLDLIVEDAVFAASDESSSLAMTTGTLKTKDGKIVVGE